MTLEALPTSHPGDIASGSDPTAETTPRDAQSHADAESHVRLAGAPHPLYARPALEDLATAWRLEIVTGHSVAAPGRAGNPVELEQIASGDALTLWVTSCETTPDRAVLRRWLRKARGARPVTPVLVCRVAGDAPSILMAMPVAGERRIVRRAFTAGDDDADDVIEALFEAGRIADGLGEQLVLELEDLLERRPLGRAFVRDFRDCLDLMAEAWTGIDEDASDDRRTLALLTLSRLLFVAFLQARGWLDDRPHFVAEEAAVAQQSERDESVYRSFLCELFFGVLNTPPGARSARARALGRIPYLNGGLFCESRLERDWPRRDLPDATVVEVLERLFGRYTFASAESDAGTVIDPAMLGQVFESLMEDVERSASGSYYTPRRVVHRIVCEALTAWAVDVLEGAGARASQDALQALFGDAVADDLTAEQAEILEAALRRIRVLDPAAGSGAFVIGVFEALVAARRALARRCDRPLDVAGIDALRRHVATHNVFGVDLLPSAIRLCELRLWLALGIGAHHIERIEDVPPLPNLDLSLRQGDSLLELDDLDTVLALRELPSPASNDDTEVPNEPPGGQLARRLGNLKSEYLDATGSSKARLAHDIGRLERELFTTLLEAGADRLDARIAAFERLGDSRSLFGERRGLSDSEAEARDELVERRDALRAHREALHSDEAAPCFAYGLHFAEVMRDGGFDVVVGNPPWVRPHRQSRELKKRLRRRYRTCHEAAWRTGARLGRGLRAGQVDLAAVFVERSLQLTRPDGVVALLVPSKLFASLSGGGMRRMIEDRGRVVRLIDWSSSSERMFGATTYPALLALRRRGEPDHATDGACRSVRAPRVHVTHVSGLERQRSYSLPARDLNLVPGDAASPWVLERPETRDALERMRSRGAPIGQRFRLRRGIVTGRNAAFIGSSTVIEPESGLARVTFGDREVRLEREMLRPILRGSDVAAWRAAPGQTLLLTHDEATGEPLGALPEHAGAWLQSCREALERRSDLRTSMPWWSVFRMHAQASGPKVVWRDIGTQLEAVYVPATQPHPVLGDVSWLPLNTVYYTSVADDVEGHLLAALLNSSPARRFAAAVADHARGGYRRFYSWVVGLVPWPFDTLGPVEITRLVQASERLHGHRDAPLDDDARRRNLEIVESIVAQAYGVSSRVFLRSPVGACA